MNLWYIYSPQLKICSFWGDKFDLEGTIYRSKINYSIFIFFLQCSSQVTSQNLIQHSLFNHRALKNILNLLRLSCLPLLAKYCLLICWNIVFHQPHKLRNYWPQIPKMSNKKYATTCWENIALLHTLLPVQSSLLNLTHTPGGIGEAIKTPSV